jgi:hypothetical protein
MLPGLPSLAGSHRSPPLAGEKSACLVGLRCDRLTVAKAERHLRMSTDRKKNVVLGRCVGFRKAPRVVLSRVATPIEDGVFLRKETHGDQTTTQDN